MNWINEIAARGVEVVNPMRKTPDDCIPTFVASAAVSGKKVVTATVLPIFGRAPVVADAASRTMLFWVVKTEKVPAGCAGPTDH